MDSRAEGTQESNPETKSIQADSPEPCSQKHMDLSATCLARIPGSVNSMGLFNRLPRELRDMIYEEVLGNQFLYISWFQPRRGNGYFAIADKSGRSKGKLALLKTCRDIYIEAIAIFYSTTTFAFGFNVHTDTPRGFLHVIPSQYLGIITSICVSYAPHSRLTDSWDPSVRTKNWMEMWLFIAWHMPMLKDVTVKLGGRNDWVRYLMNPSSKGFQEWFLPMAVGTEKLKIGVYLRIEFEDAHFKRRVLEDMSDLFEAIRRFGGSEPKECISSYNNILVDRCTRFLMKDFIVQ